jgi:hypothetical protein
MEPTREWLPPRLFGLRYADYVCRRRLGGPHRAEWQHWRRVDGPDPGWYEHVGPCREFNHDGLEPWHTK